METLKKQEIIAKEVLTQEQKENLKVYRANGKNYLSLRKLALALGVKPHVMGNIGARMPKELKGAYQMFTARDLDMLTGNYHLDSRAYKCVEIEAVEYYLNKLEKNVGSLLIESTKEYILEQINDSKITVVSKDEEDDTVKNITTKEDCIDSEFKEIIVVDVPQDKVIEKPEANDIDIKMTDSIFFDGIIKIIKEHEEYKNKNIFLHEENKNLKLEIESLKERVDNDDNINLLKETIEEQKSKIDKMEKATSDTLNKADVIRNYVLANM